jgi:hypothetical protein
MDLKIAVGKPILVEKITNPSWKDIETLYKTYVREMEGLYYRHAGENPPPLNII